MNIIIHSLAPTSTSSPNEVAHFTPFLFKCPRSLLSSLALLFPLLERSGILSTGAGGDRHPHHGRLGIQFAV